MKKDPDLFLLSHFALKLSIDFKKQLMTSYCLQIDRIKGGNLHLSDPC